MARVVFSRAARAHVATVDIRVADAVLDAVTSLESEPRAGKQLRGRFEGLWSLRIGTYRVIYQIRDAGKTVRVVAVLHRRIAYRSDPPLGARARAMRLSSSSGSSAVAGRL